MNKQTDLEICKAIAEIEGIELMPYTVGDRTRFYAGCQTIYNPLSDDALCFKLMVKYRVYCEPFMLGEEWACRMSSFNNSHGDGYVKSDNPNKAICLAIITKHKAGDDCE